MSSMVAVASAEPVMTATDAVRGVKHTQQMKPQFKKRVVRLVTDEAPGTVIVDTTTSISISSKATTRRRATASASAAKASAGRAW
jgi:hypothetical protein